MRAGLCTVSAPLAACSPAAALPPSARFLALHLLHQQTLYFIVQAKSRVKELYQQTCLHYLQQGMQDTDLFGLALICDGEYLFAEPESKLSKYAPKSWRSSHSHGLDANGRPALAFYFRVQFYVDSPLLLRDEITRYHYYLQLRLNAASGGAGDKAINLAGLALQADFGNISESLCFRSEDYVPPNMRGPAALRAIEGNHRRYLGLSKSEAQTKFIAEACQLSEPVNAHIFRLKASKNESSPGSILLAVCAKGLRVCPDNNPPSIFLWSSIGKLSFERKKFEIRTGHEKLTLFTSSDEKSRLLLALCKATHQFSMAVAPRLNEVKKKEEDRQRWSGEQRISVISSTSSNTTSGIVSDRVHSEDELEIMITSPPAQSMESLALAHLLDSAPASSRTSAASATLGFLKMKDDDKDVSSKPICSETSKTSSIKCAGSQCSSTCSTVVVSPRKPKSGGGRKLSTSSSLELGYSHTAQNSTISDATCIELDLRDGVYTCGVAPSSHTSGFYTLSSSEQYSTQSDHTDGLFRDRSNSNVSNSGSFHGDGSDPTDKQQALLSAEELSDLIVGKGKYPSCKNVSNTLDTDSDYVTLSSSQNVFLSSPTKIIDDATKSKFRPPPPYPDKSMKSTSGNKMYNFNDSLGIPEVLLRHPPPYPEATPPMPPSLYPSEEVANRFINTTRPHNIITAQKTSTNPSFSSFSQVNRIISTKPPIFPKVSLKTVSPRNHCSEFTNSKANISVPCAFLPPPPPAPRHPPPPPPPPGVTTIYTSQLSKSQIDQYHQQMFSDVDFVVFPLKEPAISKQEYLEAKQGSILAALAQNKPVFYRSTPYLNQYASSQNLSDSYVQLPSCGESSLSSTGSLKPPSLPPNRSSGFMRIRSDDNILNSIESQPLVFRRMPPPPPPAPPIPEKKESSNVVNTRTSDEMVRREGEVTSSANKTSSIDIRTLREKSKKLDLPLISALCNDRSLIKQTKAFVLPKHPSESIQRHSNSNLTRQKYPVSGLSSSKINKTARKPHFVNHRHPGDKLPEIPRATPNNYVVTETRNKHKNTTLLS